jgi:hypothetical protein
MCCPKAAGICDVAGGMNFDFTVPESDGSQLPLHGVAINEKDSPLVIFREAHISATPR